MSTLPPVYSRPDLEPVHGEGLTFTKDPRAKLWPVVVVMPGQRHMKATVLACSLDQALDLARNRHPAALAVLEDPC